MSDQKKEPTGVTCACGHHEPFTMYVYAHWTTPLIMTCPKCGKRQSVIRGESSGGGKPAPARKRRK
jgi:hypothetical protein